MLEGVDFILSYAPVPGIQSLCRIITILSAAGLIIFLLDIHNAFRNTILPNSPERVYLSLPHMYLELFKIKLPKYPLGSRNQKDLFIQALK